MRPASLKERAHRCGRLSMLLFPAALLAAGCAEIPEEEMTPVEWIDENTNIFEQLRSFDRDEQQEGINRFLRLGREQGTEVVNYILSDPKLKDYRTEVVLARILAEWKDLRAVQFLLMHLKEARGTMRETAKEGLMVFGEHPQILEAMEELINEPEEDLRRIAAEILTKMQGPQALNLLGKRFQVEEDLEIRGFCLVGILSIHEPGRTEYLINALNDPDLDIRQLAWEALSRKKPPVSFNPRGDPLERLQAIKDLRAWALARERASGRG